MTKRNAILMMLNLCFAYTIYCMEEEEKSSSNKYAWMYETNSGTQTQDLYIQLYEQLKEKNIKLQECINDQQKELAVKQYTVDGVLYLHRQLGVGIDQETYEKMCTHIADVQHTNIGLKNQNDYLHYENRNLKNLNIILQAKYQAHQVATLYWIDELINKDKTIKDQENTILELQRNSDKKKNKQIKIISTRYNELLQNYIHSQSLLEASRENEFKYQQELKCKQQEIDILKIVSLSTNEQKLSKYNKQICMSYQPSSE